ncbi:MAG: hypothetical protein P9M13_08565 [Candidatus Ancaeobacter aquaticus]|nr:hypothetical protein [Candidatus Ancaeobacter aquaticus]
MKNKKYAILSVVLIILLSFIYVKFKTIQIKNMEGIQVYYFKNNILIEKDLEINKSRKIGSFKKGYTYNSISYSDINKLFVVGVDRIVFFDSEIAVYDKINSNIIDYIKIKEVNCKNAVWSPDGSKLIFIGSYWEKKQKINEVYFVKRNKYSNCTKLEGVITNGNRPSWAPNNTDIVYSDNNNIINTYNINSRLKKSYEKGLFPIFSNNGKEIIFLNEKKNKIFKYEFKNNKKLILLEDLPKKLFKYKYGIFRIFACILRLGELDYSLSEIVGWPSQNIIFVGGL